MNRSERILFTASLIIAPLLLAISSFFWVDEGQYGVIGSTLIVFSSIFWISAFAGVFRLLREKTPNYATWGFLLASYGAICGGAGFAFLGFFIELFGVSHEAALQALAAHPLIANAIFWIGGPAFPLSLFLLGIVLARTKTVPPWVGLLLALGGALFPVARIPRIELIAHLVDLLILIPAWYIGWSLLNQGAASPAQSPDKSPA